MKSKIVFLCTLAAFMSPMTVMAEGLTKRISDDGLSAVKCEKWAEKKLQEYAEIKSADGKKIEKAANGT